MSTTLRRTMLLAGGILIPVIHRLSTPPTIARVEPRNVLTTVKGVTVYDAGYGSAVSLDPNVSGYFYLLADRGPNYDAGKDTKAFVRPEYAPRIGRFKLGGGVLTQVGKIELTDRDGTHLSGIPPRVGMGGTGETALSPDGRVLPADSEGVDPEGLVALPDGGFWIAEEYGPSLLHLDADGRTLERVSPLSGGDRALPLVLQRRRANRGFEGLTLLPDGHTLLAVVESPLDNPKEAGRKSVVTRLLAYDTETGRSRQYLLLQDAVDLRNSDLAAITNQAMLLIEKDANFPGDSVHPATVKRVYRIDLRGASDVSDPANSPDGRLVNGRTLEALSVEELHQAGITPASKELLVDLLTLGYPHDKPEGVAVVDDFTIAVSNDDDFGITEGPAPKLLPKLGVADFNEVYFVRLDKALRP